MPKTEVLSDTERMANVYRDLSRNRDQIERAIEQNQLELAHNQDQLVTYNLLLATLEKTGVVPPAPLPVAAGDSEIPAPAAATVGVQGTDANGSAV